MADGLPPLPNSLKNLIGKETEEQDYYNETSTIKRAKKYKGKDNKNTCADEDRINDLNDENENLSGMEKKLSLLKNEMESLREQDVSLLNQLWTLSDSVQELKLAMKDRDNISECSSTLTLDMMVPVIEEHEYENEEFHTQHRYENISDIEGNKKEESDYYEPIYIGGKDSKTK